MGWYIILGTIPISVAGLLFSDAIEGPARNLWLNSAMLIVFGLILLAAEQYGKKAKAAVGPGPEGRPHHRRLADAAADPGRLPVGLDDDRRDVPRLHPRGGGPLLLPAVDPRRGAVGHLRDAPRRRRRRSALVGTIVATVVSFVVGYASIAWLLKWVAKNSVNIFVIYRVFAGTLLLTLLGLGVITA